MGPDENNSSAQTQEIEVDQTATLVPEQAAQPAATSLKHSSSNPATCVSLGAVEIIVRIVCAVSNNITSYVAG